jgi:putative ABC transport system permease protein
LSRVISSRLFGVSSIEPLFYIAATLVLCVVVFAACLGPARAATKVDPMVALRTE